MLPFINVRYNVLCHEPLLESVDKIEPMTFGEFVNRIGYSTDNLNQPYDVYRSLRFDIGNGRSERFCNFADGETTAIGDKLVYVNPRLIYGGDEADRVEVLKTMFND